MGGVLTDVAPLGWQVSSEGLRPNFYHSLHEALETFMRGLSLYERALVVTAANEKIAAGELDYSIVGEDRRSRRKYVIEIEPINFSDAPVA